MIELPTDGFNFNFRIFRRSVFCYNPTLTYYILDGYAFFRGYIIYENRKYFSITMTGTKKPFEKVDCSNLKLIFFTEEKYKEFLKRKLKEG